MPSHRCFLLILKTLVVKTVSRVGERAQWVKRLATKTDVLSLIPGTHMVEG